MMAHGCMPTCTAKKGDRDNAPAVGTVAQENLFAKNLLHDEWVSIGPRELLAR